MAELEETVERLTALIRDCREELASVRRTLEASERQREEAVRFSDILDEFLNGAKEGGA